MVQQRPAGSRLSSPAARGGRRLGFGLGLVESRAAARAAGRGSGYGRESRATKRNELVGEVAGSSVLPIGAPGIR